MLWVLWFSCTSNWTLSSDLDQDGFTIADGDCDDLNPSVNPMAAESCSDRVDNNCNGQINEHGAEGELLWYVDEDGDGYAGSETALYSCPVDKLPNYHRDPNDCDDTDASIFPNATEICDGLDNNCNERIDDEEAGIQYTDEDIWYEDVDQDGYGVSDSFVSSCAQPAGYAPVDGDCDDENTAISPEMDELCATVGVDDNCDGEIDENTAVDTTLWFRDNDGDGYGLSDTTITSCLQPADYVAIDGDCDDTSVDVFPNSHVPESILSDNETLMDNDCNGIYGCMDFGCDSWVDILVPAFGSDEPDALSSIFQVREANDSSSYLLPKVEFDASQVHIGRLTPTVFDDGYRRLLLAGTIDGSINDANPCNGFLSIYTIKEDALLQTNPDFLSSWISDFVLVDMDGDMTEDLVVARGIKYRASDQFDFCEPDISSPIGVRYMEYSSSGYTEDESKPEIGFTGLEASTLAVADIDGDGFEDIVGCSYWDRGSSDYQTVSHIVWGGIDYAIVEITELDIAGCSDAVIQDIDNDGLLDVLLGAATANDVGESKIYWGDGQRFATSNVLALPSSGVTAVRVADFNQDGFADVVFGRGPVAQGDWPSTFSVFWNDGNRFAQADVMEPPAAGCMHPVVSDVNQDGYPDVVCPNAAPSDSGEFQSLIYWGGESIPQWDHPVLNSRPVLALDTTSPSLYGKIVDLDENGHLDVVFTSHVGDGRAFWDPALLEGTVFDALPSGPALSWPLILNAQ